MNQKIKKLLKNNKNKIKNCYILCIGDIILDQYINGEINRMSPEAPIPIFLPKNKKFKLGGVGNVANNITSIGGSVELLYLSGADESSKEINQMLSLNKKIKCLRIHDSNFTTPTKTRYINSGKHIVRVDEENLNYKMRKKIKDNIINILKKNISKFDMVLISDYSKGLLDKSLIQTIVKLCNKNNKIIIADPKKLDFSAYANIDILTPNQMEITATTNKHKLTKKDTIFFGRKILNKFNIKELLITRSAKGMILVNNKMFKNIKANANEICDVTGAGDTVISILSIMKVIGFDTFDSSIIANYGAGKVIGKYGTATIGINDLLADNDQK